MIFYYLNKVNEWGYVFHGCKVCGKDFLARSRHYELCSDDRRKEQAVAAKREFDERAKGDRLEQLDEAAYYYWYNRLRKLRKEKGAKSDCAQWLMPLSLRLLATGIKLSPLGGILKVEGTY